MNDATPAWRRRLATAARWIIAAVVLIGVGRRLWLERDRLAAFDRQPAVAPLAVSGILYVGGLGSCAAVWWLLVRDRGVRPPWSATLLAYYAGHLGKYVPGKGLVVVIRAGLLRDAGVSVAGGAVTSMHETILMMATGALVSVAALWFVAMPRREYVLGCAAMLAAGLGALALPPVVSRLSRLAARPFGVEADETHAARWSTAGIGVLVIGAGWVSMGLSLAAVLQSIGVLEGMIERQGGILTCAGLTGVVSLATVGGFVSLLPGGLGSREWIIVEVLGAMLGPAGAAEAAVAAIVLRVVWIVSEAAATGFLWIIDRRCKQPKIAAS